MFRKVSQKIGRQMSRLRNNTTKRRIMVKPHQKKSPWEVLKLKNTSSFTEHIQPPSIDYAITIDQKPKATVLFSHKDPASPVKEWVMAYFSQGYLSVMLFPRLLVANQMYHHFKMSKAKNYYLYTHRDMVPMPRIGFTKNLYDPKEINEAVNFLKAIDSFTPVTKYENHIINSFLTAPFSPDYMEKVVSKIPGNNKLKKSYFMSRSSVIIGNYDVQYNPKFDAKIPKSLPLIHKAILNRDLSLVKKLLTKNPHLTNMKDSTGLKAHELAHRLRLLNILNECYLARKVQGVIYERDDIEQQKLYRYVLNLDKKRQIKKDYEYERKKYLTEVAQSYKRPRSKLHQACITGNLDYVRYILKKSPQLIEEKDNFGFTPILLAISNGHLEITRVLIKYGASIEPYVYNNFNYRSIVNAKTPEIMEFLLYHINDRTGLDYRLAKAVKENDYNMIKAILFHLQTLEDDWYGINAFDLIIQHSNKNSLKVTEFFLKFWTKPLPQGPYDKKPWHPDLTGDPFASDELINLLNKHNQFIYEKQKRRNLLSIFPAKLSGTGYYLTSKINIGQREITSTIKPASLITNDELQQIENAPQIFSFDINGQLKNQRQYFHKMLFPQTLSSNRKSYVDLWKENGKVCNFLAFDIERIDHSKYGELILFHGKLACNFDKVGIADLNFHRISLSLSKMTPNARSFVFFRAIKPGNGMRYIPEGVKYFPLEETIHYDLVQFIFNTKKIQLNGRLTNADVKAKNQTTYLNLEQEFHQSLTNSDPSNALPICYEVTNSNRFFIHKRLKSYKVSTPETEQFISIWSNFGRPQSKL